MSVYRIDTVYTVYLVTVYLVVTLFSDTSQESIEVKKKIYLVTILIFIFIFTAVIWSGVRRLRRRASDPKYPEMKALESLFNELHEHQSDAEQGYVCI